MVTTEPTVKKSPAQSSHEEHSGVRRFVYGIMLTVVKLAQSVLPRSTPGNPYANADGKPKDGYREEYYQHKLEQRRKLTQELPAEKRQRIEVARKALYERMQS